MNLDGNEIEILVDPNDEIIETRPKIKDQGLRVIRLYQQV